MTAPRALAATPADAHQAAAHQAAAPLPDTPAGAGLAAPRPLGHVTDTARGTAVPAGLASIEEPTR